MLPVIGLDEVPGRAKPVVGRPVAETGRMAWLRDVEEDCGRARDVPGRGTLCKA